MPFDFLLPLKVKPPDTPTTAKHKGSESKRERRRKKRAELHGHIAKSDKKSNKNFGEDDETQAPVDQKFRQLNTADDKPTINEYAKAEKQKNSDHKSRNRPSPSNQNKVVESVQMIGNSVFYHREVSANEEIDQGTMINIQSEISSHGHSAANGQINGFQEEISSNVKSSSEKENGDATTFTNIDKTISSSKTFLDNSKLRSSLNTAQLKSDYDLKLRSTGSPKMKSKAKISRKLSDEAAERVSPLNFEPAVGQANSISSETQDKAEEVKGKSSKTIAPKVCTCPIIGLGYSLCL